MKRIALFILILGNLVVFNACQPHEDIVPCTLSPIFGSFTDSRDGTVYKTVEHCGVVWMAENLRYNATGSYIDTTNPSPHHGGRLYHYSLALNACPNGWHLSTDEEWKQLELLLGLTQEQVHKMNTCRGSEEHLLKMKATDYWSIWSYPNGNNQAGMNILPTGYHYPTTSNLHNFYASYTGFYWTSTLISSNGSNSKSISRWFSNDCGIGRYEFKNSGSLACRCVKD